jgi:phospholipase/carboxylesterase
MIINEHKGNALPYVTSVPDDFELDKEYGIFVLMHGFGANMYDLVNLAPLINEKNFVYIFPNAPIEINTGVSQKGYAWFPIDSMDYFDASLLLNQTLDEALLKYNKTKLIIGGFSQGGMMAIHSGIFSLNFYDKAVILSSKLITNKNLKAEINTPENTRVFISHGKLDSIIPIEAGRNLKEKLNELGFCYFYKEYNMGHEINLDVIKDLSNWLSTN